MCNPLLSASSLSIGYKNGKKKNVVQQNLNFALNRGEITSLLGFNGVGKSTLLKTLSSFLKPLSGTVLFDGVDLNTYTEKELSKKIGVVLTDRITVGNISVFDLVSFGRQPYTGFWGSLKKEDYDVIISALNDVGLYSKKDSFVAELSDGERQKAMIAKALVQCCPLIILDEPTAFLDPISRIEIMQLLHKIAYDQNKTILLSSHDVEQAVFWSDNLWLMDKNNGMVCGQTEDLILDDKFNILCENKRFFFDKEKSSFLSIPDNLKKIKICANNHELFCSLEKFVLRLGYSLSDNSEEIIECVSKDKLIYKVGNLSFEFYSFFDLKNFIIKGKNNNKN